jgi:hypothetical protein
MANFMTAKYKQTISMILKILTSYPPYFVEGGDSKDHSLGFLFPRPDLLGGVSPPKQRPMSPEALLVPT